MSPLVETTAFVFGLVALGYVAGWSGLLRAEVGEALSEFAVTLAVPALLFRTMVNADFAGAAPWALWGAYFPAAAVAWAVGQAVTVRIFRRDARAGVVGGLVSGFSNLVLVGLPFVHGIYGQRGVEVLSLLISVHLPVLMAASVILFAWYGRGEQETSAFDLVRGFFVTLLSHPLIVGILLGLVWRMVGPPLPALGERFIDAIANTAGPLALFAVGLGLRRFGISGNLAPAVTMSLLKLFLLPACVLVTAKLVGLPPFSAMIAIAAASMPTGVNPYLIAVRFGTGQALASNGMTISTALAAFSTAIWLAVAHAVYG